QRDWCQNVRVMHVPKMPLAPVDISGMVRLLDCRRRLTRQPGCAEEVESPVSRSTSPLPRSNPIRNAVMSTPDQTKRLEAVGAYQRQDHRGYLRSSAPGDQYDVGGSA